MIVVILAPGANKKMPPPLPDGFFCQRIGSLKLSRGSTKSGERLKLRGGYIFIVEAEF